MYCGGTRGPLRRRRAGRARRQGQCPSRTFQGYTAEGAETIVPKGLPNAAAGGRAAVDVMYTPQAHSVYTHTHIYLYLRIYTPRPLHPPRHYKLTTLRVFHSRIPFREEFAPYVYHRVMNKIQGRPDAEVLPRRGLRKFEDNRRANRSVYT